MERKARMGVLVGTRPEAVKLAPVVRALERSAALEPVLLTTGQHRELLADTLASLELRVDDALVLPAPMRNSHELVAGLFATLPAALARAHVDALLVHGDTTSAMVSALVGYYARIPVAHVEAGLRTHDLEHPFPEEANRQIIARIARWSFAPTERAADNLRMEQVAGIHVTGNTAVDSLLWCCARHPAAPPVEDLVLVTLHRRESLGEPMRAIVAGILDFLDAQPTAHVIWPMHPNPAVHAAVDDLLCSHARIAVTPPEPYVAFVQTMRRARVIVTDSGGIQEEGPGLGKPVVVAREKTERPEAVSQGRNRIVGRTRESIAQALAAAWQEPVYSGPLPAPNPYGDGHAAERIVGILEADLKLSSA